MDELDTWISNLEARIIDPDNNNNNFSIIIICTSITNSLRNSRFSKKKRKKIQKKNLHPRNKTLSSSLPLLPSLPAMEKIPTSRHKIEYSLLVPLRYGIYNSETEMASFSSASIRV